MRYSFKSFFWNQFTRVFAYPIGSVFNPNQGILKIGDEFLLPRSQLTQIFFLCSTKSELSGLLSVTWCLSFVEKSAHILSSLKKRMPQTHHGATIEREKYLGTVQLQQQESHTHVYVTVISWDREYSSNFAFLILIAILHPLTKRARDFVLGNVFGREERTR